MKMQGTVVHEAQGAGHWYPADRASLELVVDRYLEDALMPPADTRMVAGIAPHAGYLFSGLTTGYTFRALRESAAAGHPVDTVVVLGISHREAFEGIILMDGHVLRTPLGDLQLDNEAATLMAQGSSRIRLGYGPHGVEHSVDNLTPFLQRALPHARLVAALVGNHDQANADALQTALDLLDGERKIAVIASTDLLHDPDYHTVQETDKQTLAQIASLDEDSLLAAWQPTKQVCCGLCAVLPVMRFARARGTEAEVLHYCTSGDRQPRSRGDWVVGYGAVRFTQPSGNE